MLEVGRVIFFRAKLAHLACRLCLRTISPSKVFHVQTRLLTTDNGFKENGTDGGLLKSSEIKTEYDEKEVEKVADAVWQEACARDVMVKTQPKPQVYDDVKALLSLGIPTHMVTKICSNLYTLRNLSDLRELLEELLKFGFSLDDVMDILADFPDFQNTNMETLTNLIVALQKAGFSNSAIIRIINSEPSIIKVKLPSIDTRINELKWLFKSKDTLALLERYPKLFCCDMKYVNDRFNYVFHEMGITQRQMMYSGLFDYPMEHVHARHMFLVRAGFFKKLNRKDGQIDTNPRLDTLLDSSDEEFVKKFGNMTVRDYNTFKQLLLKENRILKELEEEEL